MKIKQSLELLAWVHKSKVKANGKAPLYIRITILGNPSKEIPVGSVEPRNWDTSSKTVLKTEPEYRDTNNRITEISGELIRIYKKLCVQYSEEASTRSCWSDHPLPGPRTPQNSKLLFWIPVRWLPVAWTY